MSTDTCAGSQRQLEYSLLLLRYFCAEASSCRDTCSTGRTIIYELQCVIGGRWMEDLRVLVLVLVVQMLSTGSGCYVCGESSGGSLSNGSHCSAGVTKQCKCQYS